MLTIAASALVLGAPVVGGPVLIGGLAVASGKSETRDARQAAKEAKRARKALGKGEGQKAVTHAEAAVALDPKNSELRSLLGETYLFAGRFASATMALGDALTLDPANGRTALNLALAQIATGEWATARQTLDTHAATIPASDRGLAFALAGDPGTAVAVLSEAARQPGADAKTRQNLALSFALAGQWQQARAIAAVDLAADQVDARIMQWASFARPQNAYDQVAKLLGVTPVADKGQPERLALAHSMSVAVAAQRTADPLDAYMPGPQVVPQADAVAATVPAETGTIVSPAITAPAITAPGGTQIVFAPMKEIVQPLPVRAAKAAAPEATGKMQVAAVEKPSFKQASGSWYVQLGAYANRGVARDAWGRAVKRIDALDGMTPSSAAVTTKAGSFQRLSVGGFSRGDADRLCGTVRASGGNCFVRTAAGDKAAGWGK
jgi:Flp pilus assembly protein TadD